VSESRKWVVILMLGYVSMFWHNEVTGTCKFASPKYPSLNENDDLKSLCKRYC